MIASETEYQAALREYEIVKDFPIGTNGHKLALKLNEQIKFYEENHGPHSRKDKTEKSRIEKKIR